MRFKLDENFDVRLAAILAAEGHDACTVRSERLCGRADETVYAACLAERRTLITLDLDFANPLRFPVAGTPGLIVLRPPRPLLSVIERLLKDLPPLLRRERPEGQLWIIEPGRLRIFKPGGSGADGLHEQGPP
jgi:predicted nuclease of predicted toxin-antitoxin system